MRQCVRKCVSTCKCVRREIAEGIIDSEVR